MPTTCATLENGEVLEACSDLLLNAGEESKYSLATWRSHDGGASWGEMEAGNAEMPVGEAFGFYHPRAWFLEQHEKDCFARRAASSDISSKWRSSNPLDLRATQVQTLANL